ncbi:MAG TPA: arginine--tRNA ligase, partial [Myxococcota bacterium]|nr:arginine--tRNA ligase [Myxococcota bacterium]
MKERLRAALRAALTQRLGVPPAELPDFSVEVPNLESHGDFATNAAMLLAKRLRKAPREIAGLLGPALQAAPEVDRVEVAGPGFLNVFLKADAWRALLWDVLAAGADYGRSARERPARVMVEFVSANPTGPLHVGHGRGAVV